MHEDTGLDVGYWVERNFDAEEDRSILKLDSRGLRATLQADPVLGPLHRAAVAWREDRFKALMRGDAWRSLYGQLLMAGPTRVLDQAQAESIWKPFVRRT